MLGPLEVTRDGESLPLGGPKQRTVLAVLLLARGSVVSVDQLVDEIWGEELPDSARAAVQVYIAQLRRVLDPDRRGGTCVLRTQVPGYLLETRDHDLDLARFEELVRAGETALAHGDADEAADTLRAALELCRGPALAGVSLHGGAQGAVARLDEQRLAVVEDLVEADLALGRHAELTGQLEQLIAAHPLRERLRAQLLVALYRCGRQADALSAYRRTRDTLRDELGIEPNPQLQELQRKILAQDPGLQLPPARLRTTPLAPGSPNNLPAALTSFVGREHEIAEIRRSLARARLLTLTGTGGCGKTRLALSVAEALLGQYQDGIWLVELGARSDLTGVLQAVALAVGVRELPGSALIETLVQHLHHRDVLLVLDNCEHLGPACAELAVRVLSACPAVRILATSRTRLGVPGEIDWPVPTLAVPGGTGIPPLARLGEFASVRLFTERAGAVLTGFALTDANAAAVAAVCSRLAGIPLAIELAAARVKVLSVTQIAARLDGQLGLLSDTARHGPVRQRTLRGTMDWSYDLLTGREQALFARLSVFAGSFSLEAVEEMAGEEGEGLDVFSGLVVQSLVVVERSGETARYRLLEPLRQYAAERLAERAETERIRAWHAAYYLRLADQAEENLNGGPEQAAWFRRLELERDNLRAALRQLAEHDMPGLARLVSALWRFILVQGSLIEGRCLLDQALGHPSVTGPARARALRTAGVFAHELCDYEQAAARYAESLELFRAAGEKEDAAGVLANLGLLAANQSRFDRAVPLMQESLQLRRDVGDVLGIALSLDNLGMAALSLGDLPRARELLEESLVMFRRGSDMVGESVALNNLSRIATRQGDIAGAVALYREGLLLDRELADQWSTGYCLEGLAEIAVARAEMAEAASLLGAAATLRERTGDALPGTDDAEHRRLLAEVRAALGPAGFEEAWSRGRTLAAADPIGYGLQYASR